MTSTARRPVALLLAAILLASAGLPASAGGGHDKEAVEESAALTLLLVRKADAGPSAPALSTRLPMEITPYLWNRFTVKGGRAESSADGSWRQEGSLSAGRERVGELELESVEMTVVAPGVSGSRSTSVRVSFSLDDLLDPSGGVRVQPGQYALLRAILASRKTGGWARVVKIGRSGERGLVAEVLFR